MNLFSIKVQCYAGYCGEETPRRFFLHDRQIEVVEVIDRWLAPDNRYFKLRGDDGALYIIRNDVAHGVWQLIMYISGPSDMSSKTATPEHLHQHQGDTN
ncbi:MAG: hypothetical protein KKC76_16810 [Proteobacteria bacterium]|nr:hypothetical protein [Pseudomonadota bacterium]MBU4294755.1 hypothetical protein [Pseudomonadota bacterium]MCG2749801.1 hypothetical protein [Desulfobulbaceae bacterium]